MKLSLSLIFLTLSIITLNVCNAINYNPMKFSQSSSGSGSGSGTGFSSGTGSGSSFSSSAESSEQSGSSSSLDPFYFFVNFQLYSESCLEPYPGIWFGLMQDDNNIVCLQNTTSGSIGIVAEPLAVNLTSSIGSTCSDSYGWTVIKRNECSTISDGSNYFVSYSKEAEYPSTSISGGPRYIIQNYDENCETVLSYWIADAGTTVEDYTNTFNTQYLCSKQNVPSTTVCTSQGSCKNTPTPKKCTSKSLTSISCI